MLNQDLFVGVVAMGLGAVFFAAAALNWNRWYEGGKVRWLVSALGRGGARAAFALVGIGLIALGCAIALGFRAQIFS